MNVLRMCLVACALVAVSCTPQAGAPAAPTSAVPGQNSPAASPPSGNNALDIAALLSNTQWRLTALGPTGNATPILPGTNITLEFQADGKAGGYSGCNSYGGTFKLNGSQLSLSELMSTLLACADVRANQQEQEYLRALKGAGQVDQTGNRLTIRYDNGQSELIFVRAQASISPTDPAATVEPAVTPTIALLENQQWNLVSFGASGSQTAVLPESRVTLSVADGKVNGSSGCNSYQGAIQSEWDKIRFQDLVVTERACLDPLVTQQEQKYLAALQAAEMFEVKNNRLTILYDGGHSQLNFSQ